MRAFWNNRKLGALALVLIIFTIFLIYAVHLLSSERKELKLLREERKEMLSLKNEFTTLSHRINALEMKKDISHVSGIMEATDDVFSSTMLPGVIAV